MRYLWIAELVAIGVAYALGWSTGSRGETWYGPLASLGGIFGVFLAICVALFVGFYLLSGEWRRGH